MIRGMALAGAGMERVGVEPSRRPKKRKQDRLAETPAHRGPGPGTAHRSASRRQHSLLDSNPEKSAGYLYHRKKYPGNEVS